MIIFDTQTICTINRHLTRIAETTTTNGQNHAKCSVKTSEPNYITVCVQCTRTCTMHNFCHRLQLGCTRTGIEGFACELHVLITNAKQNMVYDSTVPS